eukprot:TRINITY_DN2034_c0_g1_i2.p1 TRINITY_DN2034_c0_g1~~TRINITY_DN2034_c0_g1_i2.p1  ORF type:complete len:431 (+),score=68.82 TRINITY_DN2034_c0_g1_i2:761-2053(+)
MDSPISFSSSLKKSSVLIEPESRNFSNFTRELDLQRKDAAMVGDLQDFIGVLEVYIHQARDIHNICIYHKQDVYAKICLTSNPEITVSTQIVNGGGKNPVFNENLSLNVRTIDCSLKCEVWMLSRVKNYLEDQLLGFALVPLSDVVIGNGRLMQEFSLSSTDLFHSPAGFVQLSLSYCGSSPEVMAISAPPSVVPKTTSLDPETEDSLPCELDKIEFPDLKVVNENNQMVSEYFEMSHAELDSQGTDSFVTSENDNHLGSSDLGVHGVESFSADSLDSVESLKNGTPPSSVSTTGSPTASVSASSQSLSDPLGASKSPNLDTFSSPKGKKSSDVGEVENKSLGGPPNNPFAQSGISINLEPEQPVVQQDFVDMYMKSMQQFTESLAKMKLPMDIKNGSNNSESDNSGTDHKLQASKSTGSRVFYGSRAFF